MRQMCDAHKRLIGLLQRQQWGRLSKNGRKIIYRDGSVMHVPKRGPATITWCGCGMTKAKPLLRRDRRGNHANC